MRTRLSVGARGFVFGLALVASAAFGGLPSGVSVGQSTDKNATIDLPSGMRVVIEEDHSKPFVAVVAVVNVGGGDDPVGKEGLAHLVEHLTFRAKPDGKVQRANVLDFAGASSWNGFTTHDVTRFGVIGPKESLRNLLVIEGGRLVGPLAGIDAHTFEVERGVVTAELSQRDEQGDLSEARSRLAPALYPEGHRYHRPVKGSATSVGALSLADAQAFVQQHYVPSNVTLYVAGDVDISTIHQVFGATLPKSFIEAPPSGVVAPPVRLSKDPPAVPPVPVASPVQAITAPVARPMLYIAWSLPRAYEGDGALERALRSAVEAVPVWASRQSDIESIQTRLVAGREGTTLVCAVVLKEGRAPEKSLDKVADQFHRFVQPGAGTGSSSGQEETSRLDSSAGSGGARNLQAQNSRMSGNEGGNASISQSFSGVADTSAAHQFARLQMTAVVDDVLETESLLARAMDRATMVHWTGSPSAWDKEFTGITELGQSKWQAFVAEWLNRDRARVLFVLPNGASTKEGDGGGTPGVFAPDDVRVKVSSGALKIYAHGPVGDIRTLTLKNGLQVLLVRRLGAPTVAATLGVKGGSATAEPLGVAPLAVLRSAPTSVANGPPSQFGATVAFTTGPDATYLEGRAASGNVGNLLAVLSDTAQSLHVDDSLAFSWSDVVDNRRRADTSPNVVADRKLRADAFPGSVMGRSAEADALKKIGASDLQRWLDRSLRPHNAVLAVVGDIDVADVEVQVRERFEGWKGEVDPRAEAPIGKPSVREGPAHVDTVEVPGAAETEIRVGCSVETPTPTDVIALRMLGAHVRTKLGSLARSALGGSDGFTGGAILSRQVSELDVMGTVDGRALNAVLTAARQQIAGLEALKLTEEEFGLLRWRQGIAWNGRYTTNSELAQGLVWTRLADLPMDLIQNYSELLAAVTAEDVTRVAAACRKTAVLLLVGDPAAMDKALFATEAASSFQRKAP